MTLTIIKVSYCSFEIVKLMDLKTISNIEFMSFMCGLYQADIINDVMGEYLVHRLASYCMR